MSTISKANYSPNAYAAALARRNRGIPKNRDASASKAQRSRLEHDMNSNAKGGEGEQLSLLREENSHLRRLLAEATKGGQK
jgi:hypothetical protein